MTNAEFFNTYSRLKAAHMAYSEIFKDEPPESNRLKAVNDPFVFAFDGASTALQPELKPGSIVQIKTNLHGEGESLKWASVESCEWNFATCMVNLVVLRFADGSSYTFEVKGRVKSAMTKESDMKYGDIKSAEIPSELISLAGCANFSKCPLKVEGACMK